MLFSNIWLVIILWLLANVCMRRRIYYVVKLTIEDSGGNGASSFGEVLSNVRLCCHGGGSAAVLQCCWVLGHSREQQLTLVNLHTHCVVAAGSLCFLSLEKAAHYQSAVSLLVRKLCRSHWLYIYTYTFLIKQLF